MTEKLGNSDCEQCSKAGRKGRLKTCQINFSEAVIICTHPLCSFGLEWGDTVSRCISEINLKGKSKDGQCTANQSFSISHAKACIPSAVSVSAAGSVIQTSKQPLSVASTTSGSHHTGIPGVKNLGKDQIIQNFLHQLPLVGKPSCNVGKLEGQEKSSTVNESIINPENPNSLSATKSFTKLKLKHGFEGFQFNKKNERIADEDKRKDTEICNHKSISDSSNQSPFVNQKDKINMEDSSSLEFSAIKNTSNCKHMTDSKDILNTSVLGSTFVQADQAEENSDEWKWERFLQWQNKDALCWLDVVLCLLVHNQTLFNLLKDNRCPKESVVFTLLKACYQAQDLINGKKKCLKQNSLDSTFVQCAPSTLHSKTEIAGFSKGQCQSRTSGLTVTSIQTGAGNSPSLGMQGESLYECPNLATACKTLEDVREAVWQRLQSKLKCEKGKNDSPVLAFSALVQETPEVKAQFQMRYRFSYTCIGCGEAEESIHENILPSFPNTAVDFSMERPAHIRKCMKCQQESSRVMTYERLPNTLVMHFAEGLPYNNWTALNLQFQGDYYEVKGVIRYTNNPDHFTAWIRNGTDDTWMECDDLKSPVCCFYPYAPNFPPQEIHIVMWEKRIYLGGSATKYGSRNPPNCPSTNASEKLESHASKLNHLLLAFSNTSSLGKAVLADQASSKLGWKTSKSGRQPENAHYFRKVGLNKGNSCNSGNQDTEANLDSQYSFSLDAQGGTKLGILQKSAVQTFVVGTKGQSSLDVVTCKCVHSSDMCVCDQNFNKLPSFISTTFDKQSLIKPSPLHSFSQIPYSLATDQNYLPVSNSLVSNKPVYCHENKRGTISKVSGKIQDLGLSGANANSNFSKNASEKKQIDFMFVSKAENISKAAHFSIMSGANTSLPASNAPTRPELNAITLLRSVRKQRESKTSPMLAGNPKASSFSSVTPKPNRNWLKEGNVKSVNGDSVSKEGNVKSVNGDSVSKEINMSANTRKPVGAEQFLSTFGRGRGHSLIGSKFEGLKLPAKNDLEGNPTSVITDLRMASPVSSLCSEPVNNKQARKKLSKQKTLKSSQSHFDGLQIMARNSTQSFDSRETTACNIKGANITGIRGRKDVQDAAAEITGRSPVKKDLSPVFNECQTKNIVVVGDTNSNRLSQNSAGAVHFIQIGGEGEKRNNYLSDILSKFRKNNSVPNSTFFIIHNQSNQQERQNIADGNGVITDETIDQPLGSKICDNKQNGKENKASPIKSSNGTLKSCSLDLGADLVDIDNASPSKKRKIEKEECEILQDLYQALNIPLSEVRNTMSEIVLDVATDMNDLDPYGLTFDTSLQDYDENEEIKTWQIWCISRWDILRQ